MYGTTLYSGADGYGTVFKITLHSFDSTDDASPTAALVQAKDGSFYGTALYGGPDTACGTVGCGTIFKITPGGTLTTLHNFRSTDGAFPVAG